MPEPSFVPLSGSERSPLPGAQDLGPVDPSARIGITLVTRRRADMPAGAVTGPAALTSAELAARHGTDPADEDLIRTVLARHHLEVTGSQPGARLVKVAGTVADMSRAFGASLRRVRSPHPAGGAGRAGAEHRYREGGLRIPAELDGVVLAVLGLDDRPQARPHFRWAAAAVAQAVAAAGSFTPAQVAGLYGFPAGTDGSGQIIALIELGGGFSQPDLNTYFSGLGIVTPSVTAVSVDGGANRPTHDPSGPDGEVMLDIEVAGAAAPGARQLVYFAPNTDQGFVTAVSAAAHASPPPAVISISWGQSEDAWTAQGRAAMDQALADAAALGVTVCAAAGDHGSSDSDSPGSSGIHTDFPAASPHALACGGTSLHADPATGVIAAETVWNDGPAGGATGGGISDTFALPSWQAAAGVPNRAGGGPGRGVPDVAGNADPATGYQVLADGKHAVAGGTSAVAPLWAALISRLVQARGKPFGLIQPLLYEGASPGTSPAGFRDITSGSNGAYPAGPGWDACTGLGSPDGTALLARLGH